ncbi:MAG: indolepyruvate oxidoreductase subunit beta [Dehalococcoidia bacterium]|nr:indolepyruvate oxidoreductase subunit beta [Dehalococcoidia bacterium]
MHSVNLLITGVGGQGVVLASDILAEVALVNGYDVKKTDTLGMAQRGGSVVTNLRIGEKLASPLIGEGETDILLAFEKLEAARWSPYLKQGSVSIVSNQVVPPLTVSLGKENYPSDDDIVRLLQGFGSEVIILDGPQLAWELGNSKVLNVLMLGALSTRLPFPFENWQKVIEERLPTKIVDINIKAFICGKEAILRKAT